MTKRDLFIVIIRVIGLFLLLSNIFSVVPSLISYSVYSTWQGLSLSIAVALIIIGLFIILVQKADRTVDWLKLDKGFDDERIEMSNLNEKNLLTLAILLFGGYLIVTSFPSIIIGLINLFYNDINYLPFDVVDKVDLALESIFMIVGYLMLTNSTRLVNWMITKRSKSS